MEDDENEEQPYQVLYQGDEEPHQYLDKDGSATVTYPNGDTFEGCFVNLKRHGKGKYVFTSLKASYDGDYVDGSKTGVGTFVFPDGGKYVGEMQDGQLDGQGVMTYANGDRYAGLFQKGQRHGDGTYFLKESDSQMTGIWQDDQLPEGIWRFHDGTYFTGKFINNQPSGEGELYFVNGNMQVGCFENGKWLGGQITVHGKKLQK